MGSVRVTFSVHSLLTLAVLIGFSKAKSSSVFFGILRIEPVAAKLEARILTTVLATL